MQFNWNSQGLWFPNCVVEWPVQIATLSNLPWSVIMTGAHGCRNLLLLMWHQRWSWSPGETTRSLDLFFLYPLSSLKWILCCFTQRRGMLRCDVHFKEVRASFVTAAPAALGIFRVENKQPGNVWNATWPFNLTRRSRFSPNPHRALLEGTA